MTWKGAGPQAITVATLLFCHPFVAGSTQPEPPPTSVRFTDNTVPAGIRFRHVNGAFGKKYLPETLGSGCAFFDMDGDGWQDVLLVNSRNWPGQPLVNTHAALYRNNRNGTFSDVSVGSGLDIPLYGIGVAAADYDNDGRTDVVLTAIGGSRLFRNAGQGKFVDVTRKAGLVDAGFPTSALWIDFDKDGRLDLFVAHYVDWTPAGDLFCTLDGTRKSYCTPESYKGESGVLFKNRPDGSFQDVTKRAGLYDPSSKGLGVAMLDFDGDGWPDLFVANDTQPNRLYRNRHDGTFVDVGLAAGVAFSEAGVARAGMGVDAADYDGTGRPSIVVGNFSNEMLALFRNEGNGLFIDEAPRSTVGRASLLSLTFGCFFFDYDLDGRPDIFAANGHVDDGIEKVQTRVTYAQRLHLFRNAGQGRFDDVSAGVGAPFQQPAVARGAAYADYDRDGDLDLLVAVNNGSPRLLRNDQDGRQKMIRIQTIGVVSNRDGVGARVEVTVKGGATAWQLVKTGSSYASQSELPLTFGLGGASAVDRIRVSWPSGRVDVTGAIEPNQSVTIKEGAGISGTQAIPRPAR